LLEDGVFKEDVPAMNLSAIRRHLEARGIGTDTPGLSGKARRQSLADQLEAVLPARPPDLRPTSDVRSPSPDLRPASGVRSPPEITIEEAEGRVLPETLSKITIPDGIADDSGGEGEDEVVVGWGAGLGQGDLDDEDEDVYDVDLDTFRAKPHQPRPPSQESREDNQANASGTYELLDAISDTFNLRPQSQESARSGDSGMSEADEDSGEGDKGEADRRRRSSLGTDETSILSGQSRPGSRAADLGGKPKRSYTDLKGDVRNLKRRIRSIETKRAEATSARTRGANKDATIIAAEASLQRIQEELDRVQALSKKPNVYSHSQASSELVQDGARMAIQALAQRLGKQKNAAKQKLEDEKVRIYKEEADHPEHGIERERDLKQQLKSLEKEVVAEKARKRREKVLKLTGNSSKPSLILDTTPSGLSRKDSTSDLSIISGLSEDVKLSPPPSMLSPSANAAVNRDKLRGGSMRGLPSAGKEHAAAARQEHLAARLDSRALEAKIMAAGPPRAGNGGAAPPPSLPPPKHAVVLDVKSISVKNAKLGEGPLSGRQEPLSGRREAPSAPPHPHIRDRPRARSQEDELIAQQALMASTLDGDASLGESSREQKTLPHIQQEESEEETQEVGTGAPVDHADDAAAEGDAGAAEAAKWGDVAQVEEITKEEEAADASGALSGFDETDPALEIVKDAMRASHQGDVLTAADCYRKAVELVRSREQRHKKDVEIISRAALFHQRCTKNFSRADELFKEALGFEADHVPTLVNYAAFRRKVRADVDGSEALYVKALAIDAQNPQALAGYAHLLSETRQNFAIAQSFFQRAVKADPRNAQILANYARCMRQQGKFNEAEALYRAALAIDPKCAMAICNYATFLIKVRENYVGAKEMYEKGLKSNPGHSQLQRNYVLLLRDVPEMRDESNIQGIVNSRRSSRRSKSKKGRRRRSRRRSSSEEADAVPPPPKPTDDRIQGPKGDPPLARRRSRALQLQHSTIDEAEDPLMEMATVDREKHAEMVSKSRAAFFNRPSDIDEVDEGESQVESASRLES